VAEWQTHKTQNLA